MSLSHYFDEAGTQILIPLIASSCVGIPSLQISARTYALTVEAFTTCGQGLPIHLQPRNTATKPALEQLRGLGK